MDYIRRRARADIAFSNLAVDGVVITHMPNVLYLSGFTGSAAVLVGLTGKWILLTDGRYLEQARTEVAGMRVVVAKGPLMAAAAKWIAGRQTELLGIEADHMTVGLEASLRSSLPKRTRLRRTSGLIEGLRLVKEREEVDHLRSAVNLGCELLDPALKVLQSGVTEAKIAAEIEHSARERGAQGMSFETIVASGPRSALPHGKASSARIPRKGFVVMDFGVILANYCSDMTRTVHMGRPSRLDRNLYEAVREAQQAAVEAVGPEVEIGTVDEAARSVLRRAGLAKYFTHSTGHGVGLEIHEAPRIARGVKQVLKPGMVITIEPGAYIPGHGGVRIEDMVLVTETGRQVLTKAPKELTVL